MAKALTSVHSNSQHLCLLVLLICLGTTLLAGEFPESQREDYWGMGMDLVLVLKYS